MSHFIVGLDIGSRTIKAVVGEVRRDNSLAMHGVLKMPSAGVRKGVVADIGETTQALSPVIGEIKKISKQAGANIYLGVGASDVRVQPSVGVVAVSRADYEIFEDDVNRAIQSAQAINLPNNRMILHAIVREYIVDGVKDIRDPLEMVGNRLEVNSLIIDAFAPAVKNLSKCVEVLGSDLGGLILGPLAAARAVLTKNQRELGVALVDIGFGKTSMAVYEEGKLLHTAIFPVGSGNVTNDLAIGLKISVEAAETVKLSYGSALAREVGGRDLLDLVKIDSRARGSVTKRFIAEVIEVRLAEILEFVQNELKYIGRAGKLPAGVVFVGGGAKIPGIVELGKQELKLAAQVGIPELSPLLIQHDIDLGAKLEDPEFALALGLLFSGYDKALEGKPTHLPVHGFFKKFLNYFAP
jgi:cell division protein FtsA